MYHSFLFSYRCRITFHLICHGYVFALIFANVPVFFQSFSMLLPTRRLIHPRHSIDPRTTIWYSFLTSFRERPRTSPKVRQKIVGQLDRLSWDKHRSAVTIRGSSGVPVKLAYLEPVRAAIRRTAKDVRAAAKEEARLVEEAKAKATRLPQRRAAETKQKPKKTGGQSNRKTVKKAITKVASQPKKRQTKKK